MAQGKLKVKSKVPDQAKKKRAKGNAVTKRTNRPVQAKTAKHKEAQKLKQIVTKNVNKAVEEEIRSRATDSKTQKLSKAQKAVADYHKTKKKQ